MFKVVVLSSPALLLLVSCTTISEQGCATDSWYDVGFRGAMKNARMERHLNNVRNECGKHGYNVNITEYRRGFDDGVDRFCKPNNGYQWGRAGKSYNGVCASSRFKNAYDDGYAVFQDSSLRTSINGQISSIRYRMTKIEKKLDEKSLSDKEARQLRREHDRLRRERRDLIVRLENLPPIR